jgi:hypothetical protein
MSKYWDLYVLYLERCKTENYINDIDPNHYRMEFNHFWPKSIFGDWPVGQFLTLRQHAIASALQTLVFKENCMCGWHKQYLPPKLLELAWTYYYTFAKKNAVKGAAITNAVIHAEKDENGKSLHSKKCGALSHAEKDENGLSVFALEKCGIQRKRILVIYPDNSIRNFRSISEASRFFNVKRDKINKRLREKKPSSRGKLAGLRFEQVE